MKKYLYPIIILLIVNNSLFAQVKRPILKAYAYNQATLPGKAPQTATGEDGKQVELPVKRNMNRLVFFEILPGEKINLKRIWIDKKAYSAECHEITQLPLLASAQADGHSMPDTLINTTSNKVLQVDAKKAMTKEKISSGLAANLRKYAVVLEYNWKGKLYYYGIKTLKNLPAVPLQ